MTIEQDLLELEPERAVELKFQVGRARHGGKWVGKRPILEAHDEVLDALAYLREEMKAESLPYLVMVEVYRTLLSALQGVRILIDALEETDGSQNGVEDDRCSGPDVSDATERGRGGV